MSSSSYCILICSNYLHELKHVLKTIGNENVYAEFYPAKCENNCKKNDKIIDEVINKYKNKYDDVCVLSCSTCIICNSDKNNKKRDNCNGKEGLCFNFLLNNSLIEKYVSDGYYILTPGWLLKWKYYVQNKWGFDENMAKDFFKESANCLLLLDSMLYEGLEEKLKEMSEFVGLPYQIEPVGLDYFRYYTETLVNNWMFKQQREQTKEVLENNYKKLANYVMAFDLISKISILKSENEIINNIMETFSMIFAPKSIIYAKIVDDKIVDYKYFYKIEQDIELINRRLDFYGEYAWTESGNGFKLKISVLNQLLGIVIIDDLQFPEYKNQYRRTSLYINQICGLAISNARQFDELDSAKQSLLDAREIAEDANYTKSKFLSIIAHDMKNPFNAILGFSDIIVKKYDQYDKETIKTMVSYIHESSQLMFELLQNLLMWSRSQMGVMEWYPVELNLNKNIQTNISILNINAENKKINIEAIIKEDIMVIGDENMLSTIIRNLISNSIKFTYENGNIWVTANQDNGFVQITVSDDGVGMSEETMGKVFDMSQKYKREGTAHEEGTGLGLLLCKEFVNRNGGKIWVESEPDKGSTFTFTIPLA